LASPQADLSAAGSAYLWQFPQQLAQKLTHRPMHQLLAKQYKQLHLSPGMCKTEISSNSVSLYLTEEI
jgi:hypothetical protein